MNKAQFFSNGFQYDIVVSLGEWCVTSVAMRKFGIQTMSLPFDWSGGILWDKCGFGGLSGKVDLICNNFENFFNIEDFEDRGANPHNEDYWFLWVVNKRTGLQYKHDFPTHLGFHNSFLNAKTKYLRRVDRLYNYINNSDKVLFLYISFSPGLTDSYLIEQQLKLQQKFPQKTVDFLCLCNDSHMSTDDVTTSDLSQNVRKISFNFGQKMGEANDVILENVHLRNILSCISLSPLLAAIDMYYALSPEEINSHKSSRKLQLKYLYYWIMSKITLGKRSKKYETKRLFVKFLINGDS